MIGAEKIGRGCAVVVVTVCVPMATVLVWTLVREVVMVTYCCPLTN